MQDDVVKIVLELANCVPNLEEKVAIAELPKAINQKLQRTTPDAEVVVETNENLLEILDVEVTETGMVVIALETAEKNVCKLKKRIKRMRSFPWDPLGSPDANN